MTELAPFGNGFDNPSMDDNLPKPRRWFRFSLRTMFVLVTMFCIAIALLQYPIVQMVTIFILALVMLHVIPILAGGWAASMIDKWDDLKRAKVEQSRLAQSIESRQPTE